MKALSRFTMLVLALSVLLGTSGCFHHHKHVRNKPRVSEAPQASKVWRLPKFLEPARQVSVPKRVYTYLYYPTVNVYYDTSRNLYFFTDGEDWQEATQLPAGFLINKNEAMTVRLKSDKPFLADVSRGYSTDVTW